jgi:5-methylcytosine-specific restriction endonuclease McrA
MLEYYAKNPDKCRAIANKAYVKNKHKHILRRKVYSWNKTYGIDITHDVYLKMLIEQEHKCAICNLEDEWNGNKLIFVLDHIDGNASNNIRENLRLVCPNCDSQLDTFKRKNKNSARRERYLKSYKN